MHVYINNIENKITLKIKLLRQSGYFFEFLTQETMKLLGRTE